MNKSKFSRRSLIKQTSYISMLPWILDQFRMSHRLLAAQGQAAAKRLIIMVSPNGVFEKTWNLDGDPTQQKLAGHSQLSPLKDFSSHLSFVHGLRNSCKAKKSHVHAPLSLLTSVNPIEHSNLRLWTAGGESIDQTIANHLYAPGINSHKSANFGVAIPDSLKGKSEAMITFTGPGQFLEPYYTPNAAFDDLFGNVSFGGEGSNNQNQASQQDQLFIIEKLIADINSKKNKLPAEQTKILNQHLESLLEKKVILETPVGENLRQCQQPNRPSNVDEFDLTASSTHMIDLLVQAMKCDLTRVGTIQLCDEGSGHDFGPILGASFGHYHGLTHSQNPNDPNHNVSIKIQKIVDYFAGRMAYLINQLKNTPDPSGQGTLFDNTIVVWTSSLEDGFGHKRHNMPIVYATGSNMMKTGKTFTYSDQNHGRFLITLAKSFGVNLNSFGNSQGAFNEMLSF